LANNLKLVRTCLTTKPAKLRKSGLESSCGWQQKLTLKQRWECIDDRTITIQYNNDELIRPQSKFCWKQQIRFKLEDFLKSGTSFSTTIIALNLVTAIIIENATIANAI
jgi:hypothetical protein